MLDTTAYSERDKCKLIKLAATDAPHPRSLPRPPKLSQIREERTPAAIPGLSFCLRVFVTAGPEVGSQYL